ncbi:DNA cytosine methyltransferase [Geminisphaera colitermitum]|uniref:DNA cytosine methyltransferase n=1 Tax=Geminisphaera colitermitum TaxID=1148786 RepID=UPI000158C95E|nr:DNA cytosine methyltransferase [Geminisphaera colitermitum]
MTPRPPPPLAAAPALTFGSLFAGIGGFDLGFKRAGMNDCWQIEIDENCRDLLRRRFPTCEKFADIREVDVSTLAPVDVICGGFPCQDLSVAGKRAGLSGARSGLFYELVRIVAELRPRFVVWENVPGLLSSDKGRDFARVLHALAGIGYHGVWRLLDAQHFGVAQSRRRLFGVFARGDFGAVAGAEILSLAQGLRGHPAPRRKAQEDVAGTLGSCSARGGRRTTDLDGHGAYIPCITGALNPGAHPGGFNGQDAHSGLLISQPQITRTVTSKWEKGTGGPASDECQNLVADCLTSNCRNQDKNFGRGLVVSDAFAFQQRIGRNGHGTPSETTCALTAGAGGGDSSPCVVSSLVGVRRLTPLECERLQGFPDGWTAGHSDSVRYRMLGNAVAVPCAEWIGRRIVEYWARNREEVV